MRIRKGGPLLRAALFFASAALVALLAFRRFRRYEVGGESMLPSLGPGDYVLVDLQAYARSAPRRGEVVIAQHPQERGLEVLKRVAMVDLHGGVTLVGDNAEQSTDSRHFGAVPVESVRGRVLFRYWPLLR